jgi:hypothetical protein
MAIDLIASRRSRLNFTATKHIRDKTIRLQGN